jgi:ABC-type transport system involved in cytochrome bd biosynthesis fused ATPase/permease subunit
VGISNAMALLFVRVVLPALIAVTGIVLVIAGGDAARGAGIVLIGVAGLVVLANLFIRLGLQSERDREREEARRRGR